MKVAERKVPGGKLVRTKVEEKDGRISAIRIEGDFFIHPEEGLKALESALIGADVNDKEEMMRRLGTVIMEMDLRLIGFSANDIIAAIGGR